MYSDAGLLGALVLTEASAAGKVVGAVAAALRSASVTEEQVAAAKKNMLADIYTLLEEPTQQVENMGAQVKVWILEFPSVHMDVYIALFIVLNLPLSLRCVQLY